MTACVRVRTPAHKTAHLAVPGSSTALCGAVALGDGTWLDGGDLPDCRVCASAARVADAVAAWQGPSPRAGVLALLPRRGDWDMAPVGECAECGRIRMLPKRGLCAGCYKVAWREGTVGRYGQSQDERVAEFARCRRLGFDIRQAAARTGVCTRTGNRYEEALTASGQAPWRRGVPYAKQAQRDLRAAS
jgi:hypothetical protein